MSSDAIVTCTEVTKNYGSGETVVKALRGVNIELRQGEFRILAGPSGSGKTTLLSVIASILKQDSGECTVLSKDINHLLEVEKTAFRGKHIGFVFQAFNLIPMLTCQENVAVPLIILGENRKKALEEASILLTKLGLEDKCNRYPPELSGGEQQRVSIARGCVHRPDLILCDEPTSFLDHQTGKCVLELLKEIQAESGCTLLVVTHDQRIFEYCDKLSTIEDGRIVNH